MWAAHSVHDQQPFPQVLDREQSVGLFQSQDQHLHLILQAALHLGGSFVSFDSCVHNMIFLFFRSFEFQADGIYGKVGSVTSWLKAIL